MQIVNKKKQQSRKNRSLWWIGGVMFILLVGLLFQSVSFGGESFYFCDMETMTNGGNSFKGNSRDFGNGATQNNEKAFIGQYAAKCDVNNLYGPVIEFEHVHEGDVFEVNVWRQSDDGYGVVAFQGDWGFYMQGDKVERMQNGWELIKRKVVIPIGVKNQKLKIFPYNNTKKGAVFFDDLKIIHHKNQRGATTNETAYKGAKLDFQVTEKGINKLKEKRLEAYSLGNLLSDKTDLVDSKMKVEAEEIPVQIRLKGDLLDHLRGKKWSFRVICEDDLSWRGMSEFSIHNTLSRDHLSEWIFHELLREEDILTTRYDFVEVALNEETLGIYAYEEHFKEALLQYQGKNLGPILRISEDGQWRYASKMMKEKPPWYQSAHLAPYNAKATLNQEDMYQVYLKAQNLLHEFLSGQKKPTHIFDVDKLAKYTAILDVCLAYHAFVFTNIRFYYDPVSAKLEPIGFDGYTDDGTKYYEKMVLAGAKVNERSPKIYTKTHGKSRFHYHLFNDLDFTAAYLNYVEEFTSEEYLMDFLKKKQTEIEAREAYIQREYSNYQFDWTYLTRNAELIRDYLFPLEHISLKAYTDPTKGIVMESYHYLPIEIVGFGDNDISYRPKKRTILESYSPDLPVRRYDIPFKGKAKTVFFKTLGTSKIHQIPLFKWQIPERQAVYNRGNIEQLKQLDFITVTADSLIFFDKGSHSITEDVIVPEGYELKAFPGTQLILENNASIVSYSPVYFVGEAENPIEILSNTGSGQGFMVVNAPNKSLLRQVVFKNLSARQKNGQLSKAAVLFQESNVHIENCYFLNLRAKDALGLIRSDYFIRKSLFQNTQSDAIDADYSTGQMEELMLETIGKDGIEISGGTAKIYGTTIKQALGTGLNVNLHAHVLVGHLSLSDCKKGLSATDLSTIKVDKLVLNHMKQGMVAYKDLPEFGGGSIEVTDYTATAVEELHMVGQGAKMMLKGEEIGVQ